MSEDFAKQFEISFKSRPKRVSSFAGIASELWRYWILIQRTGDAVVKARVLEDAHLFTADIDLEVLEQIRHDLGMSSWAAYLTFFKGVLCDGKGRVEVLKDDTKTELRLVYFKPGAPPLIQTIDLMRDRRSDAKDLFIQELLDQYDPPPNPLRTASGRIIPPSSATASLGPSLPASLAPASIPLRSSLGSDAAAAATGAAAVAAAPRPVKRHRGVQYKR